MAQGPHLLQLSKSKSSIEIANKDQLIPMPELIKQPVGAGELYVQIAAASEKLREDFGKCYPNARLICTMLPSVY